MAKVLFIEDNPITRRKVRSALEGNGFAVSEAADGHSALRILAAERCDLVLQDLVLPDVDGFELVALLRALPGASEIPIVACSGFLSKSDEARLSGAGFNDVIMKPIEPAQMIQVVRAHLPASAPVVHAFGKGRKLLVADDDPVQRKLVCFLLERLGFETAATSDGVEAFDKAQSWCPDLIVSDVMMPRLDGFGLCLAVRKDAGLAATPIILMTNTYIEEADRELAASAGANEFLLRTPDMRGLVEALEVCLEKRVSAPFVAKLPPEVELETQWARRVMSQLERQVALNAGVAQRCATLSAELSVLGSISDALARHQNIEVALTSALSACFDAGAISLGALFILSGPDRFVVHPFGHGAWSERDIATFFGHAELLANIVAGKETVLIPGGLPKPQADALLRAARISSALVVPLQRGNDSFGALLMASKANDLDQEDLINFAQAVGAQMSQALALAQTFAEKDASEARYREQADVFRSVLESIGEGVAVADKAGRFLVWNPAADLIMGKGPTEQAPAAWPQHYGLRWPDGTSPIAPSDLPLVQAMFGKSVSRTELSIRREGSTELGRISMSANPLRDEQGAIRGGVAVFQDITSERATQTQLMVADRMASIGMLAAGVAHEINNPLAAVLANVQLALESLASVDAERLKALGLELLPEALGDACESAERVRHIVRDLKVFSREDDDKNTRAVVDIHAVLDSVLRMARNEIRHRARVSRNYGEVPYVEGDEARLGQVFLNLLVNAAQAIPVGRANQNEIRLATHRDDQGRIVVEVVDTGVGISPETLNRLFTPFFTTKPIGLGTGLGLSICHRLVTAMGGTISVTSQLGRGTTFRVVLQPSTGVPPSPRAPTLPVMRAARKGSVLAIDDEPSILDVVERVVRPDHHFLGLTNAREGLERILRGERFDLVLCDLMMPIMTGMDFYVEVHREAPEQAKKIVFLTGGAFTSKARAFLESTNNQQVEKPFDAKNLRSLINSLIR
jgi:CheY-like chemotaxis protein